MACRTHRQMDKPVSWEITQTFQNLESRITMKCSTKAMAVLKTAVAARGLMIWF